MTEGEILDIAREAVLTLVFAAGPILLVGLAVGLTIALVQTLTQIQEMTLVFVPKIMAVFLAILFFTPYMINQVRDFAKLIFDQIVGLG